MKKWHKGSERSPWKVIFANVFYFFAIIHPTCKDARKELTIKRSVDDLDLFNDQRRRSARIINLIFVITVEWICQLSTACKSDGLNSN